MWLNIPNSIIRNSLQTTMGIAAAFSSDMPDSYFDALSIGKADALVNKYKYNKAKASTNKAMADLKNVGAN